MTQSLTEEQRTTAPTEPGDHDRFAHYVDKDDHMKSLFSGVAIKALCGKKWVVTRDAKGFPVCPECKRIYEEELTD